MSSQTDQAFIAEYEGLVRGLAKKLRTQLELTCELEDLVAFGYSGLLEARSRFDPERGVQFNTFAYYRVRGAMIDGVRKMAYLPRSIYVQVRAQEGADLALETAHEESKQKKEPTDAAGALGDMQATLERVAAAFVLASTLTDVDPAASAEEQLVEAQGQNILASAVSGLPEREQLVIRGFYFENKSLDELGKELGLSRSWVSRIHTKGLDLLRKRLDK